jgi:alkyl hydroperoxide reductase subunit AhpC
MDHAHQWLFNSANDVVTIILVDSSHAVQAVIGYRLLMALKMKHAIRDVKTVRFGEQSPQLCPYTPKE